VYALGVTVIEVSAGGDPLQQPHRRASEMLVDNERGANVQRTARESGPSEEERNSSQTAKGNDRRSRFMT